MQSMYHTIGAIAKSVTDSETAHKVVLKILNTASNHADIGTRTFHFSVVVITCILVLIFQIKKKTL